MTKQKSKRASIRIATAADVPAIAAVVNSAFAIETFHDGTRTDEKNIAELMGIGEFLIMENEGGRILASVYVEVRGERGYFGMFAVEPSYQGHGLARLTVEAAENHCRSHGCEYIDFKVLSPRTVLLPFYHRLGYIETGTEEFPSLPHLKEGMECHFILMSKKLDADSMTKINALDDKYHCFLSVV